jgi:SAM-dependent methyltransferase
MPVHSPSTYSEIDWNLLWKNARARKSWPGKKVEDWDKNARAFADRNTDSPYAAMVISRLPLDKSLTVLDIGSGPGTLALPLAAYVSAVTAVDYSAQMLKILSTRAKEETFANIRTITGSWEDDWNRLGIGVYDLVIASRSLGVEDLEGALNKIHEHTGRFACIVDRIAPSPFDPAAFKAVGRPLDSGPDYIYTLNILYGMGIHPSIDILELERDLVFPSREKALEIYTWMFKDLSKKECSKLDDYLSSRIIASDEKNVVIRREFPPRWAMIQWKKSG